MPPSNRLDLKPQKEALRAAAREGGAGAHFERGQRLQKKLPRG